MKEVTINELVLPSSFDEMEKLEPFVEELHQKLQLRDSEFDRILLCLSEAANNALIHGNREDPNKKVFINARHSNSEGKLFISVRDEGEGFDPDSLPDPLQEENLLKEGGRGIFLIKQYSDDLHISDNGTKITMVFDTKKISSKKRQ